MKRNVGNTERALRAIVGLVIIAIGVFYQSWWGAIGLIPLVTGAMGWCPPYALLGFNTCRTRTTE
jgi:hypothetical protein